MIVITGASDGLGMEIAKLYALEGQTVANISRRTCDVAEYNFLGDLSEPRRCQDSRRNSAV